MQTFQIYPETPYDPRQLGSLGNATNMIIRKQNYPVKFYDEQDKTTEADDDRLLQQDRNGFKAQLEAHTGHAGEGYLLDWIQKAEDEQLMTFLKDVLSADKNIRWTGFRITASIHRGNGCTVLHLSLFAKHPDSDTELCSGTSCREVRFLR